MERDFFMTKKQHFKYLRGQEITLVRIVNIMAMSYKAAKRWNKVLNNNSLIR